MFPLKSFDPSSFWMFLPPLTRLYLLFLCLVCTFSLYKGSRIILRLRSIKRENGVKEHHLILRSLAVLRREAENLSQLLHVTFLLFGVSFLTQIPAAFMILEDSRRPVLTSIFSNLAVYIAYAADVFLVLLVLRLLQWFVSFRISTTMLRSGNLDAADGRP